MNTAKKCAYYFAALLLLAVSNSCNRSSRDAADYGQGTRIKIDIDNAVPLIGNVGNLEIVGMDISTPAFPGEVITAVFEKDYFVLLDMFSGKGVYGYDYNGKQTFAYNRIGRGPEEVLGVADIQVYNDSIYVLDEMARKIVVLDRTGRFLSRIDDCPSSTFFAIGTDSGMYFDHVNNSLANDGFNLTYVKNGSAKGIIPIEENLKDVTIASVHSLTNMGDTVSYMVPCASRILGCKDGKVREREDIRRGGQEQIQPSARVRPTRKTCFHDPFRNPFNHFLHRC